MIIKETCHPPKTEKKQKETEDFSLRLARALETGLLVSQSFHKGFLKKLGTVVTARDKTIWCRRRDVASVQSLWRLCPTLLEITSSAHQQSRFEAKERFKKIPASR